MRPNETGSHDSQVGPDEAAISSKGTSLDVLGCLHRTDKSSGWHNYLVHYERHLRHLRDASFTLLELGVGFDRTHKGASLFAWRDYFPNARIVGVDIRADAAEVADDRITVEIGDCSDPRFLADLVDRYYPTVVIDDASHIWTHQRLSLRTIVPILPNDSIFIMEDLHTSFGIFRDRPVFADDAQDTASLLMALAFGLVGSRHAHPLTENLGLSPPDLAVLDRLSEIAFIRSSAILRVDETRGPDRVYR